MLGQPFNTYWGLLTAPMIAFWLAYTPSGLRALWTPSGGATSPPSATEP
jgi:hypothetical protein